MDWAVKILSSHVLKSHMLEKLPVIGKFSRKKKRMREREKEELREYHKWLTVEMGT